MRFKHSSTMDTMERKKKNNKQSSNSCMASFFNFFAKRNLFSSKKKFLPSIHTPTKSSSQKINKTNLVLEGMTDETRTSTTTQPLKKSRSLVARLMGLDPVPAKPKSVPVTLETVQTNLSSVPTTNQPSASKSMQEKPINASGIVQNQVLKTLHLASKSVREKSPITTNVSETVQSVVWKPLKISAREKSTNASESVQNIVWKPLTNPSLKIVQEKTFKVKSNVSEQNRASKSSNQNQKLGSDPYPTRLVKSPPRSISPIENVKLLEATVKVLDIGAEPVMTRFVNPEKFGSKLNDAISDLDELKDNTSNNSCSNSINSNNNKGGTKRLVGTAETKKDLQKSPTNRRKSQEKTPLKHNNLKQNKSDQSSKDFIALNRSMLNNTSLRKKHLGVETKTENKTPGKKTNKQNNNTNKSNIITTTNNNNNANANVNVNKTEGLSDERAGKELLISKGAGQVSEKPVFKKATKGEKGEDMSIVSFTFSSPLKHKHALREFSRVYKEENNDRLSQIEEDGSRKSPVSILQATLLNNGSSPRSSNGISDLEVKETSPTKTEQTKFVNENQSIVPIDNINTNSNIISSTKIATNKLRISSESEANIQLFLQNILSWNSKSRQVSTFVNDATKTILETLYKNTKEENYLLRYCISDLIIEHLDLLQNRALDFGYNSWRKFRVFYTKGKLVKEIEKETLKSRSLEGVSSEILVEKDMENWDELGLNFEIGVHIENEIISELIGEIITDLVK